MKREVMIRFDKEADKEYKELQKLALDDSKKGTNTFNVQLLKSIKRNLINIQIDPHYGKQIPKKHISKETIKKYGTNSLWKVRLVGYWRLIYTLLGDEIKIISIVLEFMDHDKYKKIFGYKKR